MRVLIFCLLFVCTETIFSQKIISPKDRFTITGNILNEKTIHLSELSEYPVFNIKKIRIINHAGEKKEWLKKCRGIRLSDVLNTIELDADHPKKFSEYYFVCIASDGYKVTYSWNEIFNQKSGNNIYILTEKDGKTGNEIPGSVILINKNDEKTGKRYIKGLSRIEVKRC